MKKCPRDGTKLSLIRIDGFVLDKCHACDGVWCDHGELEAMKKAKLSDVEERLEKSYGDPAVPVVGKDGPMRCPCCDGRLIEQTYGVQLPMRIDRCDACFGIWLDDKELDAALGNRRPEKSSDAGRIVGVFRTVSLWLS